MTSKSNAHTQTKAVPAMPAIIVLGLNQDEKHCAATFTQNQIELATKAAELMNLRVLTVEGPELTELAADLPTGRIYASGHGFVPPVRSSIYDKLNKLADPTAAPGLPTSWDEIDVGHLVLSQAEPDEGYWGWWESIVVAKDNDMLTVKWRNYPKEPLEVRHRTAVALLKPTVVSS